MADQRSSGNSGWYSGGRDPFSYPNRMSQFEGMSHTRTASGMDYHEEIRRKAAQEQLAVRDREYNTRLTEGLEKAMQKQEQEEQEENIYYLLS